MKVSVVTAATLLAFIGLKSNTYMSVFVHLFSILFIKERHIVLWDVWPAMCVCVGVLDFLRSLPNLSGGQLSFLCAVEVCRTPQWKWYWWLLFFPLFFPMIRWVQSFVGSVVPYGRVEPDTPINIHHIYTGYVMWRDSPFSSQHFSDYG